MPEYRDKAIDRPVEVMVQLRRLSDCKTSEPYTFTLIPASREERAAALYKDLKRKRGESNSETFETKPKVSRDDRKEIGGLSDMIKKIIKPKEFFGNNL